MRKDILIGMMGLGILLIAFQSISAGTGEEYFTGRSLKIMVYFVRIGDIDQESVEVESTISFTREVARAAILKLLEGLTPYERIRESLDTAIPRDTKLRDIWIEDGVAYVDFSRELLNYGGGSCNALLIQEQIKKTLKQFLSVKKVIILVDGQRERLQP